MSSKRLKVLQVAVTTTGGVGQVILDLTKYLDQEQFEVTIACGAGYWLDKEFVALENRIHFLPLTRQISLWGAIKSIIILHRLIRKERFDIVHAHTSIGGLVGRIAAWTAGAPVVIFHIHALASHPHQNPLKRLIFWSIERLLDPLTDRYISVSEHYKQLGSESGLFAASKVETILNGAVACPFNAEQSAQARDRIRTQLEISPVTFVVGTVTRLEPQKAVHVLLEGFARLTEKHQDSLLLIAGDGFLREELQQLANKLGIAPQVKFLGWREDVRELLASFDVFALSSRWEGMPIAILEAMAASCPVVSTAIGGVPEMIESEHDGLLVPDGDAESLGTALHLIYQDRALAQRLSENALTNFTHKFSVTRMVENHQDLYCRLTEAGK